MKGIKQLVWKLSILSLLSPCLVLAQESVAAESQTALERIEQKIDSIATQSTISNRINIEQPLGERTQGFEFNFFRLLTLGETEKTLSGTYSFFNTQNNTEIAFPFMLSSAEHSDYYYGYDTETSSKKLTSFTVDAHYRKYLGHRLDGFYLSAFARAAFLNGLKDGNEAYSYYSEPTALVQTSTGSEIKLGIGFGIGYRIISDSGYYWGTSLSVGKYIVGESDVFRDAEGMSATVDDEEFIIDIELLKFGFAF